MQGDPGPRCEVPQNEGWTDAADRGVLLSELAKAALLEKRVVLRSPRGQLVGGPGRITFAEDSTLPRAAEKVLEIGTPAR